MEYEKIGGERSGGFSGVGITKWAVTGQTVEGVYLEQREGKYGPLLSIQGEHGEIVVPGKPIILDKMQKGGIRQGDQVKIEYLGKRMSSGGREYMAFEVYRGKGAPVRPQPQRPAYDEAEFDRLFKLIVKDKGEQIAKALGAAAAATGDPVKALQEAMNQIGTPQF